MMLDASASPFVGLRPFDVGDQSRFFGRAREVAALARAIRGHAFTAVIGASGSGKSSLVRAGVIPQLERADWRFLITSPGTEPIARLSRELALLEAVGDDPLGGARRYQFDSTLRASAFGLADVVRPMVPDAAGLVLVIDQFEELFRYGEEARGEVAAAMREESRAYVELLLTASRTCGERLRIVITMRSDYFGNCAAYAGLAEAVSQSQYLVPVPTRDQLEQAIREPLALSGATIDDALVQRLLIDVEEETDRLPLLQHTLRRLWEGAQGNPKHLGEAGYVAVGRLAGSIDHKAETVARELAGTEDPAGDAALERVLKAVTALDERNRATRRLSTRSELVDLVPGRADAVDRVLSALSSEDTSFLRLTQGKADVEVDIGHEALIRSWKRLAGPDLDYAAGWIAEERQDGDRWRRLLDDARRDRTLMPWEWRRLLRWMSAHRLGGAWAERYGGDWDRVQAWGRKWFRNTGSGLLGSALVLLLAVGSLGLYGVQQRQETIEQLENLADMTIGYAGSFAEQEPRIAALMALEVLTEEGVDDSSLKSKAELVLADALARPIEIMRIKVGSPVLNAAFSPDGMRILTGSEDGAVKEWLTDKADPSVALVDGQAGGEVNQAGAQVNSVALSANGTRIAMVLNDGTVKLWRKGGSGETQIPEGAIKTSMTSVILSLDGMRVVMVSEGSFAQVWQENGKGEPALLGNSPHPDYDGPMVNAAALSADGQIVATGWSDGFVRIWIADENGDLSDLVPSDYRVCVDNAREEKTFAGSDEDKKDDSAEAKNTPSSVTALAFSPDGSQFAAVCADNTTRVYDPVGELNVLKGHTDSIMSVAYSLDGDWIVTASLDETARVWPVYEFGESVILKGHTGGLRSAAFSPEGTQIVTGSLDGTARVWRVANDRPLVLKEHAEEVRSVAFSRDGAHFVTASTDDTAWVRPAHGGAEPVRIESRGGDVNSAAFSPDGQRIVLALDDKVARVVRADDGAELFSLPHDEYVLSVQFSPNDDGVRIVTGSTDGKLRMWQVDKPDEPMILGQHDDWIWSVEFSPDGTKVVSASYDGTARVWAADRPGELAVLKGHDDLVLAASFSPDGKRIVTGSNDDTARVWQADAEGTLLTTLRGHEDGVSTVMFTEDGTRIVTASFDGTIRVWDSSTGKPIGRPLSIQDVASVTAVDVFRDSVSEKTRIAYGSYDGQVGLWPEAHSALAARRENEAVAMNLCPLDDEERGKKLFLPILEEEEPTTQAPRLACGERQ